MSFRHARSLSAVLAAGLTASVFAALPGLGSASAAPARSGAPTAPAAPADAFRALPGFDLNEDSPRLRVAPRSFSAFDVDLEATARSLAAAATGPKTFSVPGPTGEVITFDVVEDSVMEPALAAAHPEIRSYAGTATDGSGRTARFDVTPLGFHASVRTSRSLWYVDPAYNRSGETRHLSYYRASVPAAPDAFLEKELGETAQQVAADQGADTAAKGAPGAPVIRRTYRMAFVTDPTYARYFGASNVLAAKNTLISRVNQLYNDDMAIRFLLINDTDKLNLDTVEEASGPDGPCGASPCYDQDVYLPDGTEGDTPDGCDGALLDRTTFVLGQIVGADKFDIGHIGLGVNGGGIAGLGVVGGSSKAEGCTGLPQPTGDFYAVDYFAHEVGHQMGGNHTFNGTELNCAAPNRNFEPLTTQVEPGSGSTVQGYAGICRQDNLQPHSDPYFSFISIEEITNVVTAAPSNADERQVVSFVGPGEDPGFDGTDSFKLTCDGCTETSATITSANYNQVGLSEAVSEVTGETVSPVDIIGYESDFPNPSGFQVDFNIPFVTAGKNIPTLRVVEASGTFRSFTGTIVQGGPSTNQGSQNATGNTSPEVTAPDDKTLPIQTPFALDGSGLDANGDRLVYLWEQTDSGNGLTGTTLASNEKVDGPLFRVFGTAANVSKEDTLKSPSPGLNQAEESSRRSFPDMAQILADNTNAESGNCPPPPGDPDAEPGEAPATPLPPDVRDCYSEFLPTSEYAVASQDMTFRLTARDRFAAGGGTGFDEVTLSLNPAAGPFLVSSRETAGKAATPGGTETVTWDVAGTNTATLATNVRILISLNGGKTFPTVLAASTPNDGSEAVTLPKTKTNKARIKVEAVGNYFFDVNDANFNIGVPDTRITKGPKRGGFTLKRKGKFRLASTIPDSTFVCTLDRTEVPCTEKAKVKLEPGMHRFTAAAAGSPGTVDLTPARRVFASPLDDRQLKRSTKGWTRHEGKGSYRGTWIQANTKGRVLKLGAERIKKLALVVHRAPGFGRVAIFVGKDQVRTLDLSGKKLKRKVLLKVVKFKNPRSGKVRIVTLDNKPVRIDGLGVFTRARS